jgi:hypothetical protein
VIDLREEDNAFDSMRVKLDSVSNGTDKSELHDEKHDEQRTWTFHSQINKEFDVFSSPYVPHSVVWLITPTHPLGAVSAAIGHQFHVTSRRYHRLKKCRPL